MVVHRPVELAPFLGTYPARGDQNFAFVLALTAIAQLALAITGCEDVQTGFGQTPSGRYRSAHFTGQRFT